MSKIFRRIPTCDQALIEAAAAFSVADLHESMATIEGRMALFDPVIRPINPGVRIAGQAVTAYMFPGDALFGHKAISLLQPGNILVATNGGMGPVTMFAELVSLAAAQRGAAGAVVEGCVRDSDALREGGFPIWASGVYAGRTSKVGPGAINVPIVCGGVRVEPGDVIVADSDGVIRISLAILPAVLQNAAERTAHEVTIRAAIAAGETLFDWMNLQPAVDASGVEEIDGCWTDQANP